ncbi:MAG: type IX secretion system membrane protein PorP/SprF [Cyclobacteriaceae bacterium]
MKYFLSICFCVFTLAGALGQQRYMFTQYMFNGLAINPAYAGSHEALSVTALSRHQWVGMDGAPNTQTLAVHGPVKGKSIAVGGLFVRDQIGVATNHTIYGSYAYKIENRHYHLSFGLQGGFSAYNSNLSQVSLSNQDDASFYSNNSTAFLPNAGVGAYFYLKNFYAGFSIPELFTNRYNRELSKNSARQIRHYFVTMGGVLALSRTVKWKPNMMLKLADRSAPSIDLNSSFLFNDLIWLGLSYRALESIDIIFELQISQFLRFGYAYDIGTTKLSKTNGGSHEVVLNYRFHKGAKRLRNPRHF